MLDNRTTRVLRAIPEDKRSEKLGKTKTGVVIVLLGTSLVIGGFAIALRVLESDGGLSMLGLVLSLGPMLVGVLMCVLGATVWSGEIVTAAFKDILSAVGSIARIFRKSS